MHVLKAFQNLDFCVENIAVVLLFIHKQLKRQGTQTNTPKDILPPARAEVKNLIQQGAQQVAQQEADGSHEASAPMANVLLESVGHGWLVKYLKTSKGKSSLMINPKECPKPLSPDPLSGFNSTTKSL